jgi:hypothetical protein
MVKQKSLLIVYKDTERQKAKQTDREKEQLAVRGIVPRIVETCLFPDLSISPNYFILFLPEHSHPDRRRSERLVSSHRRLRIGHKNSEARYETSAGKKLGCFVIMKDDMRYQE